MKPLFIVMHTITQHFTLESKCSCPYKEGESCTKDQDNREKKKSKNDPGIVGIVLLCL